jgi:CRP/FNR family transcriptional regulator
MPEFSQAILDTLRRVPLFNELSDAELQGVAAATTATHYEAGQVVFSEGDRGGDLLIVKEGSVRVVKTSPTGRHQLIAIERAGNSLGEVSLFDGGPYSATAITATACVLLRIQGDRFRALCLHHPAIALKVIRVLGQRLRNLRRLVEDLSFTTVRGRLIAHLLRLAGDEGVHTSAGIEIELHENNEQLAARLGTVRELVSRNLGSLHGEGLIVMCRRAVAIPSVERLRDELQA